MNFFSIFFITFLLVSCGQSENETIIGEEAEEEETELPLEGTLSSLQENIFTPTCALSGCHSSGSSAAGLSLAEGESFDNLVNVESNELPSMNRVSPDNLLESYLLFKLRGTADDVGGSGSQMPKGGSALSDEQLTAIEEWIEGGALEE